MFRHLVVVFAALFAVQAIGKDHPRILVPDRDSTKLVALALRMGVKAVPFSSGHLPSGHFKGIYSPWSPNSSPHLVQVHDFVETGGRAILLVDIAGGGQLTTRLLEDRFAISRASENIPFQADSFQCLSLWSHFRIGAKKDSVLPGYLLPGSIFSEICSVPGRQGQQRCIAACRNLGLGKILFVVAPRPTGRFSTISTISIFDDGNLDTFNNRAAARAMIAWLVGRSY